MGVSRSLDELRAANVGRVRFKSDWTKTFENVYFINMTEADGALKLQYSEVENVEFWDRETIEAKIAALEREDEEADKITPNSVEAFKLLLAADTAFDV